VGRAMSKVTVEPYRFWLHTSGRRASLFGALPWTSEADKQNWTLTEKGFTIKNPDGTRGCGRPPCDTFEEAQALAEKLNAIGFQGMNQG
jgi:hypothetical protein